MKTHWDGESHFFLWSKRWITELLWTHKHFIQCCPNGVTTVALIKFTQNSNINKCLGNFNLKKTQWWRATVLCLTNSCCWLQLWPSIFNVSVDWILHLFGVKGLISSILKVQQATLWEFLWKVPALESANFVWNKSFKIGLLWTHFEMHFESWILNLEENSI